MKQIKHDDSDLIWFDWNDVTVEELDNVVLSNFDIANVPVEFSGRNILNESTYRPLPIELKNYFVTFFEDSKSATGYSCMCINKDKQIYKSKIGYDRVCGGMPRYIHS